MPLTYLPFKAFTDTVYQFSLAFLSSYICMYKIHSHTPIYVFIHTNVYVNSYHIFLVYFSISFCVAFNETETEISILWTFCANQLTICNNPHNEYYIHTSISFMPTHIYVCHEFVKGLTNLYKIYHSVGKCMWVWRCIVTVCACVWVCVCVMLKVT